MKKKRNDTMQELAQHIKRKIGDNYGFALLIYEHGEKGRMNYVSNSVREDVVKAMKEFIEATEGNGNWGTHKL